MTSELEIRTETEVQSLLWVRGWGVPKNCTAQPRRQVNHKMNLIC